MKRLSVLLVLISCFLFSSTLYEYKFKGVVVFRSLDIKIKPFFEYDKVEEKDWNPFKPELLKIKDGKKKIILIHGISPREVDEKIDYYKENMISTFKKEVPENVGLYLFLYPSLDVPLENISKELVDLTDGFDSFFIYAHSMGGILLKYALQDEHFAKKIKCVIFAGTPHLGSPLAQIATFDQSFFDLYIGQRFELIKYALFLANLFKGYIVAPNYKYLVFGRDYPKIPKNIRVINFVGKLDFTVTDLDKILETHLPSFVGLYFLKYVIDNIYPKNSVFLENDGMVPTISASAYGDLNVFFKASHADLAMRRDIIKKALELFGLLGEGI
ncbi:esterase [Thermosipho affectus]|uniref:Esterase n=1 Tax=Thermosipho affectus TaxID=660294 RepID=A0ABX3INA2_9BACT|nr:esterase [Thermosipho affectus]ONN28002.1 esterase [Thermosipho affectus]